MKRLLLILLILIATPGILIFVMATSGVKLLIEIFRMIVDTLEGKY